MIKQPLSAISFAVFYVDKVCKWVCLRATAFNFLAALLDFVMAVTKWMVQS
jgi:hypothetical protein